MQLALEVKDTQALEVNVHLVHQQVNVPLAPEVNNVLVAHLVNVQLVPPVKGLLVPLVKEQLAGAIVLAQIQIVTRLWMYSGIQL